MNLADPKRVFHQEAIAKHRRGVIEHRDGDFDRPFQGDLRIEFQEECLDMANYLTEMYRRGWIDEQVYRLANEQILNLWFLARVTLEGIER